MFDELISEEGGLEFGVSLLDTLSVGWILGEFRSEGRENERTDLCLFLTPCKAGFCTGCPGTAGGGTGYMHCRSCPSAVTFQAETAEEKSRNRISSLPLSSLHRDELFTSRREAVAVAEESCHRPQSPILFLARRITFRPFVEQIRNGRG